MCVFNLMLRETEVRNWAEWVRFWAVAGEEVGGASEDLGAHA